MTAYRTIDVTPLDIKYSSGPLAIRCPIAQPRRFQEASLTASHVFGDEQCQALTHPDVVEPDALASEVSNTCYPGSYSSIKEDAYGTAQSFLVSPKIETCSNPAHWNFNAVNAELRACPCCYRCSRGTEAKLGGLEGKPTSGSYSPTRTHGFDYDPKLFDGLKPHARPEINQAGQASLEILPAEILDMIISNLTADIPTAEYTPGNADIAACLLTSRKINAAALTVLYNHVTIPHSLIFSKFLSQVSRYPDLGKLLRRLDLSHFTSLGMGRTMKSNFEIQNMTATSLLQCLELTPSIQEVLLQEHLDHDIDEAVVRKLLYGFTNLRALDFCASSSASFVEAFSAAVSGIKVRGSLMLTIQRLSLHECFTLRSNDLELLVSRLSRLTHLDLSHTRVTDKALNLIPPTACLTHLNLGRCTQVSGKGVVEFITSHPAAKSLIYLNVSSDISRYRLLWEADVTRLLPSLPPTLRSLNLSGAKVQPSQIPLLLPLTKYLEELSIGFAELSVDDIESFFAPKSPSKSDDFIPNAGNAWIPCALRYLDLTGITKITQGSLFSRSDALLGPASQPLEVIEFGDHTITALHLCKVTNKRYGWVVKELGRRGWYVRQDVQTGRKGQRDWKMGSMWWGMRKIPVAYGEVGGLYGHYMFKK